MLPGRKSPKTRFRVMWRDEQLKLTPKSTFSGDDKNDAVSILVTKIYIVFHWISLCLPVHYFAFVSNREC